MVEELNSLNNYLDQCQRTAEKKPTLRVVCNATLGTHALKIYEFSNWRLVRFFQELAYRLSHWVADEKMESLSFTMAVLTAMTLESIQNGRRPSADRTYLAAVHCLHELHGLLEDANPGADVTDKKLALLDKIYLVVCDAFVENADTAAVSVIKQRMRERVATSTEDESLNAPRISLDLERHTPRLSIDQSVVSAECARPHPQTIHRMLSHFAAFTRESRQFGLPEGAMKQWVSQFLLGAQCMIGRAPTTQKMLEQLLNPQGRANTKLYKLLRLCSQSLGNMSSGQLQPILLAERWIPKQSTERARTFNVDIQGNERIVLELVDPVEYVCLDDENQRMQMKFKIELTSDNSLVVNPQDVKVSIESITFSPNVPGNKQEKMNRLVNNFNSN